MGTLTIETDCSYRCQETSETCGGPFSVNLYEIDKPITILTPNTIFVPSRHINISYGK